MKLKNLLFTLLILLPIPAFAHGEEVLVSLFYDLLTIVVLTIFIACLKWKSNGKILLAIVLVVSVLVPFVLTGKMPYTTNRMLIDSLCIGIPMTCVLLTYLIFRRKFTLRKKN